MHIYDQTHLEETLLSGFPEIFLLTFSKDQKAFQRSQSKPYTNKTWM